MIFDPMYSRSPASLAWGTGARVVGLMVVDVEDSGTLKFDSLEDVSNTESSSLEPFAEPIASLDMICFIRNSLRRHMTGDFLLEVTLPSVFTDD